MNIGGNELEVAELRLLELKAAKDRSVQQQQEQQQRQRRPSQNTASPRPCPGTPPSESGANESVASIPMTARPIGSVRNGSVATRSSHSSQSQEAPEIGPLYGLDAELKQRADAKYDVNKEREAAYWIEDLTDVSVSDDLPRALRSGVVLCELINCIKPGTILKVNEPSGPFKERENISNFVTACRELGVQEWSLFNPDDLYERKNLASVINCIHALGSAVQTTVPEFCGPHLSVADKSHAQRDHKRVLKTVTQTGGLHGPMERSHIDVTSTAIVRGNGAAFGA